MLLKVGSKRRRTKAEIQEQQDEERNRLASVVDHIAKEKKLKQELEEAKAKAASNEGAHLMCSHLIDVGVCSLDQEGNIHINP